VGAGLAVTDGAKEPTFFFSVGDIDGGALLRAGALVSTGGCSSRTPHADSVIPAVAAVLTASPTERTVREIRVIDPTISYPPVTTLPGSAVGAGRAVTVGENELFPPGPTFFSVGAGALDGALLSVGDLVSVGFSLLSELHAVRVPIPTMAAPPAARAIRRVH
jgi:hypothetical protein